MTNAASLKSEAKLGHTGGPCAMVIFGVGDDLARRKPFPALYNLAKDGLLPKEFAVVGFGRSVTTIEKFRQKLSKDLSEFAGGHARSNHS